MLSQKGHKEVLLQVFQEYYQRRRYFWKSSMRKRKEDSCNKALKAWGEAFYQYLQNKIAQAQSKLRLQRLLSKPLLLLDQQERCIAYCRN